MERRVVEVEGDDVAAIAAQIPRADSVGAGTRLVVRAKARGLFAKLFANGAPPASALGSALLVRGYTDIAAGVDEGKPAVWGDAPGD